ncbi:polysaccharide biosynthesis tyrosine autokinase [Anabaena sp. UHCC 0253]|uniref:GumC family protein n=2 Tax=unclassified Anabaena TaxID=2619674 RepID=UPI00144649AA|nr:polysaccharide biosynthesis tyrosine autokinase [Anabaena sp. UHCC 0253]MTJ08752.1 polysaccharide biosynthesis tyrosine autokinase [Anabaena sp. UHCC 0204]MTJ53063.1 polysaccharide biosynthesis tyrosine autokinase [Anabaena sp. UHCC 0253]
MSQSSMESREAIDIDPSHYLLVVKRQFTPAASVFLATFFLSAIAINFIKPSYEAEGKLLFKAPSFQVLGSNLLPSKLDEGSTGDLTSLVSTQNPINTQMEVIYSPPILQQTIDQLQLKNKTGEPLEIEDLAEGLKLKIIGGTDVLRLSYTSQYPDKAAAVVNTVMNLYLENGILTNRSEAEVTLAFITKQLPESQSDVYAAEIALRKFRQEYKIVDLAEEKKSAVTIISNLTEQINTITAQLEDLKAQSNALRDSLGQNSQEAIAVSALSQSLAVQGILQQLQELERQLAIERSRFLADTPIIINLEAKKANLSNLLEQEIQKTIGSQIQFPQRLFQIGELRQSLINDFLQLEVQQFGLNKKLASLFKSRTAYEKRVRILPYLEQKHNNLQQKVEVAQSSYQTFLKKVQELKVAENKNTANARIIAEAEVPKKPISGKKQIVLALGMMLGLFLSTTTILVLEMRDSSLKTLKEITDIYKYTVLGKIPLSGKKLNSREVAKKLASYEIVVRDQPYSLASEMYRMIQANLRLLSSDKTIKTIIVTSSVANEGKSTVSANLATALAQLGKKVLLVDADMRISSQDSFWKLPNLTGLSELLVSQKKSQAISFQVMPNLDVITAGMRPPNPLALLDSKRMATLIEEFSEEYDYVIIDTPPLLIGADALTLSQMTDGILLVARPGVVDYTSANTVKEMLKSPSYNVLGLLVNGVIEQNESSNYFYHAEEYYLNPEVVNKKDRIKA